MLTIADFINLMVNNGIGIVCVAYLLYFQNTTMKEVVHNLQTIQIRLTKIENTLEIEGECE